MTVMSAARKAVIRGRDTVLGTHKSIAELAALGVARVSWASLLYREAMARFEDKLASLQE